MMSIIYFQSGPSKNPAELIGSEVWPLPITEARANAKNSRRTSQFRGDYYYSRLERDARQKQVATDQSHAPLNQSTYTFTPGARCEVGRGVYTYTHRARLTRVAIPIKITSNKWNLLHSPFPNFLKNCPQFKQNIVTLRCKIKIIKVIYSYD